MGSPPSRGRRQRGNGAILPTPKKDPSFPALPKTTSRHGWNRLLAHARTHAGAPPEPSMPMIGCLPRTHAGAPRRTLLEVGFLDSHTRTHGDCGGRGRHDVRARLAHAHARARRNRGSACRGEYAVVLAKAGTPFSCAVMRHACSRTVPATSARQCRRKKTTMFSWFF
jgi:hypothetical protein